MRQGVREVTLLGQIVNLYGRHEFPAVNGRSPFAQLLHAVSAVPGLDRLRFTSPHPIGFKDDLVACFRELPNLCPHVHLPLQSGSDRILKAMHRAYTGAQYRRLIGKLRAARPGLAFTTDVIVGFPGETEDDFRATSDLVREVAFDNAFIFRYSPRRDTAGRHHAGPIERGSEDGAQPGAALAVLDEIAAHRNRELVGTQDEILVEGESRNQRRAFPGPHPREPPRPRRGQRPLARSAPARAANRIDRIHLLRGAGAAISSCPKYSEKVRIAFSFIATKKTNLLTSM